MPLAPRGGRSLFAIAAALAFVLALFFPPAASAAEVRYDYDLLGRVVRAIHPDGRVIEYVYDPAGNLLRVIDAGAAQAPVVNALSRGSIRRGQVRQVIASGTGLTGVAVSTPHPDLSVRTLAVSATSVTLSIAVEHTAPLGPHTLLFRNAAGTAQATLEVLPALVFAILPDSIAVPPDNVARQFTVSASAPEDADFVFTAAVADPAVARAAPTTFTLAAGQTQVAFSLAGLAAGSTTLALSSPLLLRAIAASVFVGNDFAGAHARYSRPLGLVKGDPTRAPGTSGPHVTPPIGLVKGDPTRGGGTSGPHVTPPVGIVKGDPTRAAGTSGPHVTPPVGIVKGDPTTPPVPFTKGPVLSPPLGLQKP